MKRVFYVTSGRLVAYHWDGRFQGEPELFDADEEGLTRFSSFLEEESLDPVWMLVDLVEEEFREDTMPHVFGRDRAALVQTKLNRMFRDSTYSHAVFQGREPSGRRDDRVMFTALIRPDLIAPWMGQIVKHKIPLVGVYSLPLVSAALLKPLRITSPYALLVSLQSGGGLRQTFFLDGQLKLSRLAILPRVEPDRHASIVLAEVEKIRRYLSSLRLLPQDSPLDVHVLGTPKLLEDMRSLSPDSVTARHHGVPLPEAARAIGLKGEPDLEHADPIFAHLLVSRRPANHYATESQTRYHRLYGMRSALVAASLLLLVTGVSWGGLKFVEGAFAVSETEIVERQIRFYGDRYDRARARLPATPVESREMKVAVELAGTLESYRPSPSKTLLVVSSGLSDFPRVRLDGIAWKASTDPDESVGDLPARERPRFARRDERAPADGRVLYQLAHVRAHIEPFAGDFRLALDTVNRFAETLRLDPRVHDVQVTTLPLDVGPDSQLSGEATGTGPSDSTAAFELRVVIRDKGASRDQDDAA